VDGLGPKTRVSSRGRCTTLVGVDVLRLAVVVELVDQSDHRGFDAEVIERVKAHRFLRCELPEADAAAPGLGNARVVSIRIPPQAAFPGAAARSASGSLRVVSRVLSWFDSECAVESCELFGAQLGADVAIGGRELGVSKEVANEHGIVGAGDEAAGRMTKAMQAYGRSPA
jgi:hypothetical protein